MEKLNFISRGDAKLYCFIEVCDQFFPSFARNTVRSWLKRLNIMTIFATLEERSTLKASNPNLKATVFGLIHENDLNVLIIDSKDKRSNKRRDPNPFDFAASTSSMANDSLVDYTDESSSDDDDEQKHTFSPLRSKISSSSPPKKFFASSWKNSSPVRIPCATVVCNQSFPFNPDPPGVLSQDAIDVAKAGPSTAVNEYAPAVPPIIACPSTQNPVSPCIVVHDDVEPPKTGPKQNRSRTPYRLCNEEAGPFVNEQVKLLLTFYTVDLNAKRNGPPLSQQTKDKLVERLYCFLYFCKRIRNVLDQLTLALFNDETLISEYVNYLSKVRELMPNTICAHLTSIINVIKYNHGVDWIALGSCKALLSCRSFQRQLARQARVISQRSKEGICVKASSQKFYFNHILDTIRNLKAKIFSSTGIKKARHLHDFVMLTTYLRVNPGRSKEIRTLQVFVESDGKEFDVAKFLDKNVIVFKNDMTVSLIENDYKTVNSNGPRNFDLSEDEMLQYYLRQYNLARPTLLQAKSHDHFFLNTSGDPFRDSASLCVYLGNLFEREVSVRVSTNALRHAIVTYFQSLEESKDIKIKESLATLMKHGTRYQQQVYDDTTQQQKTSKARDVLRTKLAPDIFGEADMVESAIELSDCDGDELVLRPNVGDICALLDSISTPDDIAFFVAKVARFTSDGREAHLVHLGKVEGSDALYKLVPSKVWRENVASLVYPIDIVYNESEQAYELRTSAKDIYNAVKGT